jgi:hypothetical protein
MLSETSKVVPVAMVRIASIRAAAGSAAMELGLAAKAAEHVDMSYLGRGGEAVLSKTAAMGAVGTVTLALE